MASVRFFLDGMKVVQDFDEQKSSYKNLLNGHMECSHRATWDSKGAVDLEQVAAQLDTVKWAKKIGVKHDTAFMAYTFPYRGKVLRIWEDCSNGTCLKKQCLLSLLEDFGVAPRSIEAADCGQTLTVQISFDGGDISQGSYSTGIELSATDATAGSFHYVYVPKQYLLIEGTDVTGDRRFRLKSDPTATKLDAYIAPTAGLLATFVKALSRTSS